MAPADGRRYARAAIRRGELGLMTMALMRRHRTTAGVATLPPSVLRALEWTRTHEARRGGIVVHSGRRDAYPEVTGYFVPTLMDYGERDLALRCVRWLLQVQREDGSFASPGGDPYVFDTGQALRGLLASLALVPTAAEAARRSADYLCAEMVNEGRSGWGTRYRDRTIETIHLYVLSPLCEAAEALRQARYRTLADRCLGYYLGHPQALRDGDLTHFLAYELEALIDLGRLDIVRPVLDRLQVRQTADGGIPGRGGMTWVCAPGLAQLALCWYKLGQRDPADRAMVWLEHHQEPSGGFLGGYGDGADYFPTVEVSWAVKFFLDAARWRAMAAVGPAPLTLPRQGT